MKKTISAIVTTYNSEKTIDRTLRSILNQDGRGTDFDIELIVADDCSTDQTVQRVKQYDAKIISTEQNSGGPNRGRNLALAQATGEYICIVDHDDEWQPNKIGMQLPHLAKVPIVSSGITMIEEFHNKKFDKMSADPSGIIYYGKNATFLSHLKKSFNGQFIPLGSLLYWSELKDIRFEENFEVVDYHWTLRLFHQRDSIEVCQPLYNRYVKNTNLSLDDDFQRKNFYYSLMILEEYESQYPTEVRLAYKRIHGLRARYYYLTGNMQKARYFFRRSGNTWKHIAYYLTTYLGANYIRKHRHVYG